MEFFQTKKIDLAVKYDILAKKTTGTIYSKIEDSPHPIPVAVVEEEPIGTFQLHIPPAHTQKDYISEEFENVKEDLINYANFWHSRASRGIC